MFLLSSLLNHLLLQIDTEVLQSLPDDIRRNIEAALRAKHHDNKTVIGGTFDKSGCYLATIDDDERPGCSHWITDDTPASESAASAPVNCLSSLPAYSQVIWFSSQSEIVCQCLDSVRN